jgi:hypothetical protein
MSAIGQTYVTPKSSLPTIESAATPRKRLLGGNVDEFWEVLGRESVGHIEYGWDGYVLATLLPFLSEQGIDLMTSEYAEAATAISNARDATAFVVTDRHRQQYLERLKPERFDDAALQRYFEEFNQTTADGVGAAMREGIAFFRDSLAALNSTTVGVFIIG